MLKVCCPPNSELLHASNTGGGGVVDKVLNTEQYRTTAEELEEIRKRTNRKIEHYYHELGEPVPSVVPSVRHQSWEVEEDADGESSAAPQVCEVRAMASAPQQRQ